MGGGGRVEDDELPGGQEAALAQNHSPQEGDEAAAVNNIK